MIKIKLIGESSNMARGFYTMMINNMHMASFDKDIFICENNNTPKFLDREKVLYEVLK